LQANLDATNEIINALNSFSSTSRSGITSTKDTVLAQLSSLVTKIQSLTTDYVSLKSSLHTLPSEKQTEFQPSVQLQLQTVEGSLKQVNECISEYTKKKWMDISRK